MRPFSFAALAAVALTVVSRAPAESARGKMMVLTVAPNGNDAWSGTRATPNRARTDGPLATLEGARDAIRKLKQAGGLPAGGVTVEVRGGTTNWRGHWPSPPRMPAPRGRSPTRPARARKCAWWAARCSVAGSRSPMPPSSLALIRPPATTSCRPTSGAGRHRLRRDGRGLCQKRRPGPGALLRGSPDDPGALPERGLHQDYRGRGRHRGRCPR